MNLQEAEKQAEELGYTGPIWRGSTNTVFGDVYLGSAYSMAEKLGAVKTASARFGRLSPSWMGDDRLHTVAFFREDGLEICHWASIMNTFSILDTPRKWGASVLSAYEVGGIPDYYTS